MMMTPITRGIATVATAGALALGGFTASASASTPKLPAHFPKPPHSKVVEKASKGKYIAYSLKVSSEKSAYDYWKKELPKKGWTIEKKKTKGHEGAIKFKGHGYAGKDTIIAIDKTKAVVEFEKKS